MEKLKMITAMLIVGTIGILVNYIPLPSSVIACSRAVIGTIFIMIVLLISKTKIQWKEVKKNAVFLILSGAALGFNWIFLFEAYKYTSVAVATLCYYMAPIFVILFSPLLLKEKITPIKLLSTIAAIIGIVLIADIIGGGSQDLRGIGFGLAAAVLYFAIIIINKLISGLTSLERAFSQLAVSAIVMTVYVLYSQDMSSIEPSYVTVILLFIVGIVHTGIVYILFFSAVSKLPAQTSAILSYIDPVTAIILSNLFLHQPLGILQVVGTILILGSTILNELLSQKKKK